MDQYKNFAYSTVVVPPSPAGSGVTLTVLVGSGVLFPDPPFNAVVSAAGALPQMSNAEIVRVTARVGDTLTIQRMQEGSNQREIKSSDQVYAAVTKKFLDDLIAAGAVTAAHAPTHQPGGTDPITALDGSVLTTGLIADPRLASNIVRTTDPRLADARPPTLHAPTHNTGGADPITSLSAGILTSGTLPDARLSANVARREVPNTFQAVQIIQAAGAQFIIHELNDVANSRRWGLFNYLGDFIFQARNDADGYQANALIIKRSGGLVERSRAVPMGEWQPYTPTWAAGTGAAPSLGNGTLLGAYTIIGRTVSFQIRFMYGTTTNGGTGQWGFSLPFPINGAVFSPYVLGSGWIYATTTGGKTFIVMLGNGGFFAGPLINHATPLVSAGSRYDYDPPVSAGVPMVWGNMDYLMLGGQYEM